MKQFLLNISKNGKKYLIINLSSVIIFALLYYLNDIFIINNIKLAKKFKFIDKNYNENKKEIANTFLYYLWFSLITQTTLGYTGLINEKTNLNVPFSKIKYNSFKFLNILQIISIFIYASLFIN